MKVDESSAQRTPTDNIKFTLCTLGVKAPTRHIKIIFHSQSKTGHASPYLLLPVSPFQDVSKNKTSVDSQPQYAAKHAKLYHIPPSEKVFLKSSTRD